MSVAGDLLKDEFNNLPRNVRSGITFLIVGAVVGIAGILFDNRVVDGRWCYARTDVPVYPWHQPVEWTDEKREDGEIKLFETRVKGLDRCPPRLHLVAAP